MNVLFICDPTSYPKPDSISAIYRRAADDPRLRLFHLPAANVTGADEVYVAPVPAGLDHADFLALDSRARLRLPIEAFDVVHCRTLKPFPPGYLDRLGRWVGRTRFLNNPLSKKEQIAPGFLQKVAPGLTPDLIVSADPGRIGDFLFQHGTIVVKRANSCGGRGVYKMWKEGGTIQTDNVLEGTRSYSSLAPAIGHIQDKPGADLEAVRYLANTPGDKRVIVIGGEIYGAFIRRATNGSWVHNISTAASESVLSEVGAAERAAIAATLPHYQARGLHVLGYDFLMDDDGVWKISEINAGNIGGIALLETLTGEPMVTRYLSWMIAFGRGAVRPTAVASVFLPARTHRGIIRLSGAIAIARRNPQVIPKNWASAFGATHMWTHAGVGD